MHECLPPQLFGELCAMQHGLRFFEECVVDPLSNTTLPQCVMHSESPLNSMGGEVSADLIAEVFPP